MARIQLNFPNNVVFETQMHVRVGDLNYGNHLGNDALLGLIQEARVLYFKSLGQEELNFWGIGIIMSDAAIVYKSEGFLGNELHFKLGLDDFSPKGFDIYYEVYNQTTQKLLAIAKTGIVCYNYQIKKTVNIPDEFKQMLSYINLDEK